MSKILFKQAQIATSQEVFCADLLIEDEKIAAIGSNLSADGAQVIDASGKYLLPGAIDVHTHFDLDVGFTRASDDFYTGSVAAACGGTTTIIDHMADGPEDCSLLHQVDVYHDLAKGSVIDYGFHGVLQHVNEQVLQDMALLKDAGINSLKFYLTYATCLSDADMFALMQRAQELGIVLCVHCENNAALSALREQFVQEGKTQAKYHPLSRPAELEAEAVFRSLCLAKTAGEPVMYIVHLSSAIGLEAARLARKCGQKNILLESCPQYLFLQDRFNDDDKEGLKYILSPPLRKKEDNEALWQALRSGEIDTLGTDHCPFFFETQKQLGKDDFTLCPNGMPGVELRFPLLFSGGFMQNRLTLPEVVRVCCTRPAEIFGIAPKKGDICIGADADLVLFDPTINWVVHHEDLHENVDYTPYEGIAMQGRPILTLSRGEIVVDNGRFMGKRERGRYLHRKPYQG